MARKKNPLVIERQDDGRPIRAVLDPRLGQRPIPDPRKSPTRLGARLLPQLPSVSPSKAHGAVKPRVRHTARPR